MERSSSTFGPDRRIASVAIAIVLALIANIAWTQISSAQDSSSNLEVSIGNFCSGDTIAAVLTNPTSAAADALVSIDGEETAVTVAPFATKRVRVPAVEDATYNIVITAPDGTVLLAETVLRDCEPNSTPSPIVAIVGDCDLGGAAVTITNPAGVAQTVTILLDDVIVETVTVPGAATETIVVPLEEDQTATVSAADADGNTLVSETVTLNCDEPAPLVTFVENCDEGGVVVTVSNAATIAQTVEIVVDGVVTGTVTVAAGESVDTTVALAEDQTATIAVRLGDGTVVGESTVTFDCQEPESAVVLLDPCVDGSLFRITNPASVARSFDLVVDGVTVATVDVPADSSLDVASPLAEDQTASIELVEAGVVVFAESVTQDCEQPAPTASIVGDCEAGGALVSVSNTGELVRNIVIEVDGVVVKTVLVDAASSTTIPVELAEDSTSTVVVRTGAGAVLATQTVDTDCEPPTPPTVDIVGSCDEGGAQVTVTNSADEAQTVRVDIDGVFVAFVEIEANATNALTVPMENQQTATISVSLDGETLAETAVTLDCDEPLPTVVMSVNCDDGAVVTITNNAEVDQQVKLDVDGVELATVTVPAGETVTEAIELVEDVAAVVTVRFGGETIAEETLTVNCVSDDIEASATFDCETDQIVLELVNPGPVSQVVDVIVDGEETETVVNAGQTVSITIQSENGATTELDVLVDGTVLLDETFVDDCGEPTPKGPALTASLTQSCAASVATVSLRNTGDLAGEYTITVNGAVTDTTVAPGATELHTFTLVEDTSYTVSVTEVGGSVSLNQSFFYDCKADTTVKKIVELPRTGINTLFTQVLIALLLLCLGALLVDLGKKMQRR